MNIIEEDVFTVQLSLDESCQISPTANTAVYKLECPEWLLLNRNEHEVAVSQVSLPVYGMDLCGNDDYFIDFNRQTIDGYEHNARCVFKNVTATNPNAFAQELRSQLEMSDGVRALFHDVGMPWFGYSDGFMSVHFRDDTPDITRPSLLRLSEKLCAKMGFSPLQQPFVATDRGTPEVIPIVARSKLPIYIYRGHEKIMISTPSLVSRGMMLNSKWSSVLATLPIDYLDKHQTKAAYVDQYQQAQYTYDIINPAYFKCDLRSIREWRVECLLSDNSVVQWAFPHLTLSATFKFRRLEHSYP